MSDDTFEPLPPKEADFNVYDYFVDRLEYTPEDETLKQLPVCSNCGEGCKRTIDKAAALIDEIKHAFGLDQYHLNLAVINACDEVITCYWRG